MGQFFNVNVLAKKLPFKVSKFLEAFDSVFGTTLGKSLARTCGSIFNVATPVSSSFMSASVEYCLGVVLVRS